MSHGFRRWVAVALLAASLGVMSGARAAAPVQLVCHGPKVDAARKAECL
jgi:hypothetical protein